MVVSEDHDKESFELHAAICRTLSHAKRLEILSLLSQGEMSVGDMAQRMGLSLVNVSQHLAVLRNSGILTTRREGVNVYYRVAHPKIIQACALMREVLLEQLERSGQLAEIMQAGR